jgi:hypothetical protein
LYAGAFGLFYNPRYCDKRSGVCYTAGNAFTVCGGCCPTGCNPCGKPQCDAPGGCNLGNFGFDGQQSFGTGGFHVRKHWSNRWQRCAGGDCGVANDGPAVYTGGGCAGGACPAGNGHAATTQEPPTNNANLFRTANRNNQQAPAQTLPVSYQGYYGMMPTVNPMAGYGFGYNPASAYPMYNPAMWQGYAMGW